MPDTVVPFKKKTPDSTKYKTALELQKLDNEYNNIMHRHGVGHDSCPYCGDKMCDYDCEISQEHLGLKNESCIYSNGKFIFEDTETTNIIISVIESNYLPFSISKIEHKILIETQEIYSFKNFLSGYDIAVLDGGNQFSGIKERDQIL